jgi:hypothetical protein
MNDIVLFINPGAGLVGRRLLSRFQRSFPDKPLEIVSDIDALKHRLLKPASDSRGEIYVILADTSARLKRLMPIAECFDDRRAILIAPDMAKHTLSDAYRLRPRLVGNVKGNFQDLCDVVSKMIGYVQSEAGVMLGSNE